MIELSCSAGRRLRYKNVQPTFQKLLHPCCISPRTAACRPRIHDVRHGFAVSTIIDGCKAGEPGERKRPLPVGFGFNSAISWQLQS
ncbi:hypothetical protein [Nitrosomonas nitrosa]|uniref:hypothetical protein n=1 Tax=Nitrosomonas nitrosa TaxID=52442 RepID=UPI0015A5B318|nr:hypothetical protein [Nitrosomonas nitrosa]